MDYGDFDRWEFVHDEVLQWTWRRFAVDGHLRMPSRVTFTTLDECVADARLYGFIEDESSNDAAIELGIVDEAAARASQRVSLDASATRSGGSRRT